MRMHLEIPFIFLSFCSGFAHANPVTALAPRATSQCAADNCLRALSNKYTATAQAFCSTYTTQPTATIPAYATSGCANNPSRVSSACTCLATSYYSPKPLHRVFGPANDVSYTDYDNAVNIRSDELEGGTWDHYLQNCRNTCSYYGDSCQSISFGIEKYMQSSFYLCYAMKSTFDPNQVRSSTGNQRYVVEERWQT